MSAAMTAAERTAAPMFPALPPVVADAEDTGVREMAVVHMTVGAGVGMVVLICWRLLRFVSALVPDQCSCQAGHLARVPGRCGAPRPRPTRRYGATTPPGQGAQRSARAGPRRRLGAAIGRLADPTDTTCTMRHRGSGAGSPLGRRHRRRASPVPHGGR